jgi:hypothetical protein
MTPPHLYIIDPYLKSPLGHPFEQARLHAALAVQHGYQPTLVIAAGADLSAERVTWPVQFLPTPAPTLTPKASVEIENPQKGDWAGGSGRSFLLPKWLGGLVRLTAKAIFGRAANERAMIADAQEFGQQLHDWMVRQSFAPHDALFFPTLSWAEAAKASEIVESFVTTGQINQVSAAIMLRFDPPNGAVGRRHLRQLGQQNPHVTWVSDTQGLADQYRKILGQPVLRVGILVDQAVTREKSQEAKPHHIHASFLGESRIEKGFHLLPKAIELVRQSNPPQPIKFFIQIAPIPTETSKAIDGAIAQLKLMQGDDLILIDGVLSSEDFNRLILATDLALAPYEPSQYQRRSSGFVTACSTAGAIIVARAGKSWIAKTFEHPDLKNRAVFFNSSDATAFARAIVQASCIPSPGPVDPSVFGGETPWPRL